MTTRNGNTSSDVQLIMKVIAYIFAGCGVLSVAETAIDSFVHQPLAEFLVKRFCDLMPHFGSLLAGQNIERQNAKSS